MDVKIVAAAVAVGEAAGLNVSAFCAEHDVSRKTFYKWVRRYRDDGVEGLEDRSRRPHRSPNQLDAGDEELLVRLRKQLANEGLDHGPGTLQWHLGQRSEELHGPVPSESTIYRALCRRGLIMPEPRKRPKGSYKRFEAPDPNVCWQIDATEWVFATGVAKIFSIIDDHSRLLVACRAVSEATGAEAWRTFSLGAQRWGLPSGVLSDNGLCFSGKLRGLEVLFEANLRDAGVRPITSTPYHPQTTGKVERFHQTLKKRLGAYRHLAGDLYDLQGRLDEFLAYYNHQRPHQGINRQLPIDRWRATPAAGPAAEPLAHPDYSTRSTTATVTGGVVSAGQRHDIGIGVEYNGHSALIVHNNTHANVFIAGELIRHLELDPTRRYQPSGRPRGGTRRPRMPS